MEIIVTKLNPEEMNPEFACNCGSQTGGGGGGGNCNSGGTNKCGVRAHEIDEQSHNPEPPLS